ncbi:hypothetical protein CY34DRAFT_801489 [Suillus luteus UH-Slu-Lm8-n1]|uniref:Uncharacterized protein n=1 Tax=Suillus luteus UH-Slu-Lm8-n1 TaxID=930992 RepID=A0A0D0BRA3_9AGAM|nr:hypothetical protein CY34DRAFT_801489 [Suillus luteus UH-Slu-Lm8-n1]
MPIFLSRHRFADGSTALRNFARGPSLAIRRKSASQSAGGREALTFIPMNVVRTPPNERSSLSRLWWDETADDP